MSEKISENSEVYNHYLEMSKPTEEDFKRVFTEGELKELCLKHKCRVDMWRWNIVNDYRILFTESGRYQRWSPRGRLRMLAKAVNKMKPSVLYDEEEIKKARTEEWGLQLKENILSLNFWKYERTRKQPLVVSESDGIDRQTQYDLNTESMNMVELQIQSESQQSEAEDNSTLDKSVSSEECQVDTDSVDAAGLLLKKPNLDYMIICEEVYIQNQSPAEEIYSENENGFLAEGHDSEDSIKTVLLNENKRNVVTEILHSEEVAPEIADIYEVNTMSMTIDSEMSTQSQNIPLSQSQDVVPPSYDFFKNIPLTSTQSQHQQSEEIVI